MLFEQGLIFLQCYNHFILIPENAIPAPLDAYFVTIAADLKGGHAIEHTYRPARSPQEKELLQRRIAFTDREIDALAYELYGLTEEEIRIVEGGE